MEPKITLTLSELLQFLGKVALPPFKDHPEADHWDCAPMAQYLGSEVEALFQAKGQ